MKYFFICFFLFHNNFSCSQTHWSTGKVVFHDLAEKKIVNVEINKLKEICDESVSGMYEYVEISVWLHIPNSKVNTMWRKMFKSIQKTVRRRFPKSKLIFSITKKNIEQEMNQKSHYIVLYYGLGTSGSG